jgi:GNAT superfamily N-acetyltransferase
MTCARVSLRPLSPQEELKVREWCPHARGRMMALDMAGELVGAVGYLLEGGECQVTTVVVAPHRRGWGIGSEGVRALERELTAKGARLFWARVPLDAGLAFYLWLRLGYRPAEVDSEAVIMMRPAGG